MGTVVKIVLAVVLVGALGLFGLFYCAQQTGSSAQASFLRAATSGDVAKLLEELHPDVRAQVDRPVLEAWMTALSEHLGAYEGMSAIDFSTSIDKSNEGTFVRSEGTVEFEKGEARSMVRKRDDKVIGFQVKSAAMPDDWLKGMKDTSLYEERAQAFLRALLAADAAQALGMMHENLRKKFEEGDTFQGALEKLQVRFGKDAPMQLLSAQWQDGEGPELIVRFGVRGGAERAVGKVRFVFQEMRGHILGFALPEA